MCNWDFVTSMETKDLSITYFYQVPTNLKINSYSILRYKCKGGMLFPSPIIMVTNSSLSRWTIYIPFYSSIDSCQQVFLGSTSDV